MATELATRTAGELATLQSVTYTRDQVDLIKRTICVDATDDELQLFLNRCAKTQLDPFLRQIYSIKRKGKHVIQVGIDGYRLIAQRTGECDGQEGPQWCGSDGVWKDVWLEKGPPAAARVTVFRRGQSRGYAGTALWAEYGVNSNNDLVRQMPAGMLAKVAESHALRKAFPQELSGMYVEEEMEQAGRPAVAKPSKGEFVGLLTAKGWTWGRALKAIDKRDGSTYVADHLTYDQLPAITAAEFAAWLRTLADAPVSPPTEPTPAAAPEVTPPPDHLADAY